MVRIEIIHIAQTNPRQYPADMSFIRISGGDGEKDVMGMSDEEMMERATEFCQKNGRYLIRAERRTFRSGEDNAGVEGGDTAGDGWVKK